MKTKKIKQTNRLGSLLAYTIFAVVMAAFTSCEKQTDTLGIDTLQQNETAALKAASQLNYNMYNWMNSVDGNLKLSQLSIPGSHEACARFESIANTAKCQSLTLTELLNAGVRFIDIRCRHYENAFTIHHGSVYQKQNFTNVLNDVFAFLNSNPSECIIMSVKEEYDASGCTRSFEQTFDDYVQNNNPSKWYTGATIPALKDVRGKIVLFRRFSASATPKGIDANPSVWGDNKSFTITNNNATIKVQDSYKVGKTDNKWTVITTLLNDAKNSTSDILYVNFCSGYKSFLGIPNITSVSNTINPKVETYFTANTKGRFGVVLTDFSDSNKSKLTVATNF